MTTPPPTLRAHDRAPTDAERDELASRLAAGQVVLMPTETVYGLAARADDPAALDALRALKGRPEAVPLSWHLGATRAGAVLDDLETHGLALAPLVRRLVDAYWPGPLTLVVRVDLPSDHPAAGLVRDGLLGLRAPAHAFTEVVLGACAFPLVMSSANRHGEPPTTDAAAALAALGDDAAHLGAAVDAGPTASAAVELSSTVLELAPGRFEVHREGLLSLADLRRTAGLSVGFACTGNTCRSPLAEGLARRTLAARLAGGAPPAGAAARTELLARFGFRVASMGLAAGPGAPASPHSVTAAARRDVDLTDHASRPADLDLLRSLDLVYTMTRAHRDALVSGLRGSGEPDGHELAARVHLLDPDGRDIADPFGGDAERYEAAAREIEAAVQARLAPLA